MGNFTSEKIEFLLAKEMYKPVDRMNKHELSDSERQEVNSLERITSFGQDILDLFDTMLEKKGTLPTQKEFTDAGVPLMLKYLRDFKSEIKITKTIREACKLRLTRTYMSKVVELHLECLLAETFPDMKLKTDPLLDTVMGVDFVLEDSKKRYYLHVTSNTPFAMKMLKQKERRGGYKVGTTYVSYSRDFEGDIILKYDPNAETDVTQIINGFPLFKASFIDWQIGVARISKRKGELLSIPYSKLDHFKDWAETNHLTVNL